MPTAAQQLTSQASCRGTADVNDRFFPDSGVHYPALADLEAECEQCPVWQLCRITGMGEQHGFWGGLTQGNLALVARQTRYGNGRGSLQQVRAWIADAMKQPDLAGVLAALERKGLDVQHPALTDVLWAPRFNARGYLSGFTRRQSRVLAVAQ